MLICSKVTDEQLSGIHQLFETFTVGLQAALQTSITNAVTNALTTVLQEKHIQREATGDIYEQLSVTPQADNVFFGDEANEGVDALKEIIGDPIFDVYDDEVLIQIEDRVDDEHVQTSVYEIGLHVVEDVQLEAIKVAHIITKVDERSYHLLEALQKKSYEKINKVDMMDDTRNPLTSSNLANWRQLINSDPPDRGCAKLLLTNNHREVNREPLNHVVSTMILNVMTVEIFKDEIYTALYYLSSFVTCDQCEQLRCGCHSNCSLQFLCPDGRAKEECEEPPDPDNRGNLFHQHAKRVCKSSVFDRDEESILAQDRSSKGTPRVPYVGDIIHNGKRINLTCSHGGMMMLHDFVILSPSLLISVSLYRKIINTRSRYSLLFRCWSSFYLDFLCVLVKNDIDCRNIRRRHNMNWFLPWLRSCLLIPWQGKKDIINFCEDELSFGAVHGKWSLRKCEAHIVLLLVHWTHQDRVSKWVVRAFCCLQQSLNYTSATKVCWIEASYTSSKFHLMGRAIEISMKVTLGFGAVFNVSTLRQQQYLDFGRRESLLANIINCEIMAKWAVFLSFLEFSEEFSQSLGIVRITAIQCLSYLGSFVWYVVSYMSYRLMVMLISSSLTYCVWLPWVHIALISTPHPCSVACRVKFAKLAQLDLKWRVFGGRWYNEWLAQVKCFDVPNVLNWDKSKFIAYMLCTWAFAFCLHLPSQFFRLQLTSYRHGVHMIFFHVFSNDIRLIYLTSWFRTDFLAGDATRGISLLACLEWKGKHHL